MKPILRRLLPPVSGAVLLLAVLTPSNGVAAPSGDLAATAPYFALQTIVTGLQQPLFATDAGDGSGRLFIVEKTGRIRMLKSGSLASTAFLDISGRVGSSGSEQGLLGLAFHPSYATNGYFFVDYTDRSGNTVVSRFHISSNADIADPNSEFTILNIAQPFANHNGGMLAFGPDGYLYIGSGDGGSGGDPLNNGQSLTTLLGKILRVDVDSGSPYGIPPTNPFASSTNPSVRKEIWAYGLRNPWRFSFDHTTGDLYIGDVGQDTREEIDVQSAGSAGGENYGWSVLEGSLCFKPSSGCDRTGKTMPVTEYGHDSAGGCAVTGGYVYRGSQFPDLAGAYLYGDYCSGRIWGLERNTSGQWTSTLLLDSPYAISSFGQDQAGEIYVTDLAGGRVLRVVLLIFNDVQPDYWAKDYIEALYNAGFVVGCNTSPRQYCPDRNLARSESAVFILRGAHGAIANPPDPTPPSPSFADVAPSFWGFGWIESLLTEKYTAGCGTNPLIYCPDRTHTRAEGSVFFLRIKNGVSYSPPAPTGVFSDVSPTAWYAGWVEAAYAAGLLPPCHSTNLQFCPDAPLNRAWAAYMMTQAKGMGLPTVTPPP